MAYGTHTLREINQQPEVWQRCLDTLDRLDLHALAGDRSPQSHEWLFVGCGTSYYLAQAAAASATALSGIPARAVPASEILFFADQTLLVRQTPAFPILISRSGHTSEVLQAAELLRHRNIDFLAITCDGNELADLTPRVLRLPVIEESTVMTSSFTSMLLGLQYLVARLAGQTAFIEALQELPAALSRLLPINSPKIELFAQNRFEDVSLLGQGPLFPVACEAALKIMESSSSYAQYFHTLEFRHGPKSIVSSETLVGALLSESGYAEESAVLEEMKQLGARTFVIANHLTPAVRASADLAIELGLTQPELARLAIYVVWGQLLGSYLGLRKGLDPDSPRHLNRVVTLSV